ncbi:unnamed protein product [Polarella glacialis]|uniref:Tyrosine specific protein phosphatases domain-containing protein n=1 Tax=Polarella glacialis TaxID=89957 RepID=A0A813K8J3_POLGL|nr:unnamed protein product [Polarella glacialis]
MSFSKGHGGVMSLGGTSSWLCCRFSEDGRPDIGALAALTTGLAAQAMPEEATRRLHDALLSPQTSGDEVTVWIPEQMKAFHFLGWDGDGHFDRSTCFPKTPPQLGDVVKYVRMLDDQQNQGHTVIHLSSEPYRAQSAVLVGAGLVLSGRASAKGAWAAIKRASPDMGLGAHKGWERFPLPFSFDGKTGETSVTVLDCLEGLQSARDLGWLDYRTFDVEAWQLLRRKFDASWLVPGEMLAFGDPASTAQNPAYPELLSPKSRAKGTMFQDLVPTSPASDSTAEKVNSASPVEIGRPLDQRLRNWSDMTTSTAATADDSRDPAEADSFPEFLSEAGVKHVVRLNYSYETDRAGSYVELFRQADLVLHDFEFEDGTAPPLRLADAFLQRCKTWFKEENGAPPNIAVHCKAGLGRTGAIVAFYATANHEISGPAFHGWARMCRRGTYRSLRDVFVVVVVVVAVVVIVVCCL